MEKGRFATLFKFVLINFKVKVKSFTGGRVSETETRRLKVAFGS